MFPQVHLGVSKVSYRRFQRYIVDVPRDKYEHFQYFWTFLEIPSDGFTGRFPMFGYHQRFLCVITLFN